MRMKFGMALLWFLVWAQPVSAAIARTASADLGLDNPVVSNTYTRSYTCGGGSNTLLFVFFFQGLPETDTGATYNGTAMTRLTSSQVNGFDRAITGYFLAAPTSGAHNVVITFSDNPQVHAMAVDYSGASQSGIPDAQAGSSDGSSQPSISQAVTVVAANSWIVAFHRENVGTSDVWTGVTELQASGGIHLADSNATVSTGSNTITADPTGSAFNKIIVVSIAPVAAGGVAGCKNGLLLRGAGCEDTP